MKHTKKKRNLPALLVLACALWTWGCKCEIEQLPNIVDLTTNGEEVVQLAAEEATGVVLAPGQSLDLVFGCDPGEPEIPEGFSVERKGNTFRITDKVQLEGSMNQRTMVARNSQKVVWPAISYTMTFYPPVTVQPGDANADGRTDMMDLYPIVLAMRHYGTSTIDNYVSPPSSWTFDPQTPFTATATGQTWSWVQSSTGGSNSIDFVHADCNRDGLVNLMDVEVLSGVLEPAELPAMLQSGYSDVSLTATPNGIIEEYMDTLRIWYDIRISQAMGATFEKDMLGVIFTRPVSELDPSSGAPAPYSVLNIQASTVGSKLILPPNDSITLQRFWGNRTINTDNCEPQGPAKSKPLDVGAFTLGAPVTLRVTDKIISCGVTLDDIMRQHNTASGLEVYQHIINGVVFSVNEDGEIIPVAVNCTTDSVSINKTTKITVYEKDNRPDDWYTPVKH